MHPTILGRRRTVAQQTIVDQGAELADKLGLEVDLTSKVKDADVAMLYQLEAVAKVLTAANDKLKKPSAKSTSKPAAKKVSK